MKKNLIVVVSIICMLAIVLAACSPKAPATAAPAEPAPAAAETPAAAPAKDGEITIVVMPKLLSIPYFVVSEVGASQAGKDLGVNVIFAGPTEADATEQVNMLEDFIAQGVDVIAVAPNDPVAMTPVLKKAKDAGIIVMDWDTPAEKDVVQYSVHQVDDKVYGEHLWKTMTDRLADPSNAKYALLTGGLEAGNLNTWIDYGEAWLAANFPGVTKVTDKIPTNEKQQEAYSKTQDVIKSYPEIEAIMCISATTPPAVGQVIQELGMQDKLIAVGTGLPNDNNVYLKDGSLDCVTLWDPGKLGYLTVWVGLQAALGNPLTNGMTTPVPGVPTLDLREDGKTIIMSPPQDFTKENVDQFDF